MAYVPGMPSNIPEQAKKKAEEIYNKKQKEKKSENSSSPSKPIKSYYEKQREDIANKQSTKITVPGLPSNLPTAVKQQAQKIYNAQYINALPTTPSLFSPDASKLAQSTNTYALINGVRNGQSPGEAMRSMVRTAVTADQIYEKLPTADRQKIKQKYTYMSAEDRAKTNQLTQDVYNIMIAQDAKYKQKSLNELINSQFWASGEKLMCTGTTAQDYYQMQKKGYQLVYVEDGCGKLANKGGVYAIGRDKLAGLPHDITVVLVDTDGNWKYLADTGDRAAHAEQVRAQQEALTARMEPKFNDAIVMQHFAQNKCDELLKRRELYDNVANITRAQGDIDALQKAIEEYAEWNQKANDYRTQLSNLGETWATWYDIYERQLNDITKWTVEDEARYQELKESIERSDKSGLNRNIRNNIHDSKVADMYASDTRMLTEYLELSKRREESMGGTVFLNQDTIMAMSSTAESMKKAVDAYNKWDSVTIHLEEGEDIGAQLKRTMLFTLGYKPGKLDPNVDIAHLINNPILTLSKSNIIRMINDEDYFKELSDIGKDTLSALYKQVAPIHVWYKEYKRANEALNKNEISVGDYFRAQQYASAQCKSILFNNVIANLSVFDLYSVQSTFVTWRMAKHPDRYSNDPKFKKFQDAYRAIYGEDYRGAMDAAHMARVMLDIRTGTTGDYIYVDGSDLRHKDGDKYNMFEACLVGMLTDISAVAGLAKMGSETIIKNVGSAALVKSATDSYIQALVRSGVAQESAEQFIKRNVITKIIQKDVKRAIKQTISDGGDDLGKVINEVFTDRAEMFKAYYTKDLAGNLDEARYMKFLDDAKTSIANSGDIVDQALLINKSTVITKTLGGIDEMLDKTQRVLFKSTCPVAGAVVAVSKGMEYIKALKNLRLANTDNIMRMLSTQDSIVAKIDNMSFDDCLDGGILYKRANDIAKEIYAAVLGDAKANKVFMETSRRLSKYKDGVMKNIANSYVDNVIGTFRKILDKEHGILELETFAASRKYATFEEMFTNIKKNLEVMYEHSPEARGIVESFENMYQQKLLYKKLADINAYVDATKQHIKNINSTGLFKILSPENAAQAPEFVQGTARQISDSIHTFLSMTDSDFSDLYDLAFYTKNVQDMSSIYESGLNAIEALDDVAKGNLTDLDLAFAYDNVKEYLTQVNGVYSKNLAAWKNDMLSNVFGQQHYLDNIVDIAADHKNNRMTVASIQTSLMELFEQNGVKYTKDEIDSMIIHSGAKDAFEKLPLDLQNNLIYRITANKGTNAINQISDKEYIELVANLTDCNSQLYKNIMLLKDAGVPNGRITQGLSVAMASENTRIIYDALKNDGVDSNLIMGVMDTLSGSSNDINYIINSMPNDIAAAKIRDYIVDEVKKQVALHNGDYRTFRELGCDTVDVSSNVRRIEENLTDVVPEDDNYIDICVSMVKSTDSASPKDIAFHIRGSADDPSVFRKNTRFTVYDDYFANRTYGKTAQQLTDDYAALGNLDTLSSSEWQGQIRSTIEQYKQMALEQNKTIRFIGFNSSDAISGGNKYLSDVLRSCGVNANTATAIDLADSLRHSVGEYVFDPKDVNALYRGVQTAIDNASAKSIALNISPSIAYDSKYNCAEIISNVFKKHKFENEIYASHAKYITDTLDIVNRRLGTTAYNEFGTALGAYIDAGAVARKLQEVGASGVHTNGELMRIISNAVSDGEAQLGLNKIIDDAIDGEWLDFSRIPSEDFNLLATRERIHDAVLQINSIHNNINRIDMITEADKEGMLGIFKTLMVEAPQNTDSALITKLVNAESLSAQQLYAVNKWLYDNVSRYMDSDKFTELTSGLFISYNKQASYLTGSGYRFLKDNIVDYTENTGDALAVKFLDDSEEGYQFAQDLLAIRKLDDTGANIDNYMTAIDELYKKYDVHGVHDKATLMQLASVYDPIISFQKRVKDALNKGYADAIEDLVKETETLKRGYSPEMMHRIATNRAVSSARKYIQDMGDMARIDAVHAVVDLDADALKAHLVRNCGGGLIIDPTAKCVRGIDFATLFETWGNYGVKIDTINFTSADGLIKDRKLFRISVPELDGMTADEIFKKYNNADIQFVNRTSDQFNNGMRHSSFNASDMTLMDANHMDNFKEFFFKDSGTIIDLNSNFASWRNELYSCNMWTGADLKRLVNPYYNDNILNNLAQNTHQLRNNISAVHDLGSIINNRYMNTQYILHSSGVLTDDVIGTQRTKIVNQITGQNQRVCKLIVDAHNKIQIIDYTPRLKKASTSDELFRNILKNTVLLDDGFYSEVADWAKATNVALKLQASHAPEWLTSAYNIYKKTIRNATITMYLYGNIGTAVRNYMDSSTKGLFETLQYDEDAIAYIKNYVNAVKYVNEYSNIYRQIEDEFGRVNRETVAEFFSVKKPSMSLDRFNLIYGYEHTCGGDSLVRDTTLKQIRTSNTQNIVNETGLDYNTADLVRKEFDSIYSSPKYYGLTNAQLKNHMAEIHDKCMKSIRKNKNIKDISDEQFEALSKLFYTYDPTVLSWGDQMSRIPVLGFNKGRFNNAEVRARLAVYQTFVDSGASEADAMKHVTATQFNYAGIGKVEDFMPFTQYKLYNALYWFDHANAHAVSTAWHAAQYNGDGYKTNDDIATMITKYRTREYYLYEQGADAEYDEYYDKNLRVAEHILLDGVDSYMGVPREFGSGNLDLNGTHYLKLGNSLVEEIDMVSTFMASAVIFATVIKNNVNKGQDAKEKLRYAYESFKYTSLYDSMYSPWKSYIDLIAYSYDKHKSGELTSKNIWDNYKDFMANKGTHSEAVAALPVVGAVLSNMVGRWKSFDLNLGHIAALVTDPDSRKEMHTFIKDLMLDIAGARIPSLVGTKVEAEERYDLYGYNLSKVYLRDDPTTFFDMIGRLQKMGFTSEEADAMWASMKEEWDLGSYKNKQEYYRIAQELFAKGYTLTEISNMFTQHKLPDIDSKRFLAMYNALPGYIKYDPDMRKQVIDYYKAMGMSTNEAWAYLLNHPSIIRNGKLVELSPSEVALLNKRQSNAYWATHNNNLTDEEWDAYWANMPFRYPKGKWSETYHYLTDAGYDKAAARDMLLHGYMLDDNGRLVDVQGQARAKVFSPTTYTNPLGYKDFNTYYQTLPDYIKYEKGAFSRTYQALKQLGFDYTTSLKLIQQGAYLMDASSAQGIIQTLGAKRERANEFIPVTDITTLLLKYGGKIIKAADGRDYMLIDCSGLQRPRKSFKYTYAGSGSYSYAGGGRKWINYSKRNRVPKYSHYYTRKPFLQQGNVSTFTGFTSYRGSNKLTKPYTTKGYVSTYSAQNFLNGASYGMRKAYKIDMRQFKTGALSIKSAYPASYRNIAVAYRRNLYKDLYAKYGMSRMRMRANQAGYSNAAIVRLRRNEIQNRERYAERRDRKAKEKVTTRATR